MKNRITRVVVAATVFAFLVPFAFLIFSCATNQGPRPEVPPGVYKPAKGGAPIVITADRKLTFSGMPEHGTYTYYLRTGDDRIRLSTTTQASTVYANGPAALYTYKYRDLKIQQYDQHGLVETFTRTK